MLAPTRLGLRFELIRSLSTTPVAMRVKLPADLPKVPKAPKSAYGSFIREFFDREAAKNPDRSLKKIDVNNAITAAAKAWNQLPSSDKQKYQSSAAEAKKAYQETYASFYQGLSAEQKRTYKSLDIKLHQYPGGLTARRLAARAEEKRTGQPQKPMTPFFEFLKEYRASHAVTTSVETAKAAGAQWKSMDDSERKKYSDTFAQKRQAWNAWHEQQGIEP